MASSGLRHTGPVQMKGFAAKKGRRFPVRVRRYFKLVGTELSCHESEVGPASWTENILDREVEGFVDRARIVIVLRERKLELFFENKTVCKEWLDALNRAKSLKLENYYTVGKVIGSGAYSKVRIGSSRESNELVAIKIIDKKNCPERDLVFLEREVDVVKNINHQNVVKTYDVFETNDELYIVLEYMEGGMLYDIIAEEGSFTEQNAADVFREMMQGLVYLHDKGIVHRDIKPENILCQNKSWPLNVKWTDFGLANFTSSGSNTLETQVGTPHFAAPELLRNEMYGPAVDMWSCGIVLYNMLSGELPFDHESDPGEIFRQILQNEVPFPTKLWENISPEAKHLVKNLLQKNPEHRLNAHQVLRHPWLQNDQRPRRVIRNDLSKLHSSRRLSDATGAFARQRSKADEGSAT
uniref:Protein kinase domain-containing protein n=1 Tax=Compsopogon caeruleus TaxID=31354 RepID=A0A7S1THS8_9RHOD